MRDQTDRDSRADGRQMANSRSDNRRNDSGRDNDASNGVHANASRATPDDDARHLRNNPGTCGNRGDDR